MRSIPLRTTLPVAAVAVAALAAAGGAFLAGPTQPPAAPETAPPPRATDNGRPSPLPLPSATGLAEYEEKLFAFLNSREYVKLGWKRDKSVRDTGPYLDGTYYGTHPAVRIYYSPGIIKWLEGGRVGTIPDGEMIIKEQYAPPAARHRGKSDEELWEGLESWTVMVKDARGSQDGWFWSNPAKGQKVTDNHRYPFDYPVSGFGLYCVRCHAAAQSPGAKPMAADNEYLFAALRNVEGYPGEPILFRVDDSWRDEKKREAGGENPTPAHAKCGRPGSPERAACKPDAKFAALFPSVKPLARAEVTPLPPVTHDHVVPRRDRPGAMVTSDQCMNCHAGLLKPFGPTMFVPFGKEKDYGAPGWDISPHGEWRWTPMGLAGRDPVFHAQLEVELKLIDRDFGADPARAKLLREELSDTCLKCHGAMGRHQFAADHAGAKIPLSSALAKTGEPHAEYGALARDGISCAVCHRMQPPVQPAGDNRSYLKFFLDTSLTGNFRLGKPGEIYGPLKDDEISPYAMQHGIGLTPKHSPYLKSSQLCATCHTVVLPVVDKPGQPHANDELAGSQTIEVFRKFHHHVEQATYLEWLNSEYENEVNPKNPRGKSCQDCHMSPGLKDERNKLDLAKLRTRIAAIQDDTYPDAENLAPHEKLNVRMRDGDYRRHNFSGLNVFLLEMFNQADDVLGVRKTDFMTGSKLDVGNAIENMLQTARRDTADLEVTAESAEAGKLVARVVVRNKTGHRFPTGVGFRRAFIELVVVEKGEGGAERVLWASGRTNEWGVIVGADGKPLPTEFFERDPQTGQQRFQPHHEEITSPDQVQLYESLLCDAKSLFTTSFVRGCETRKDNRLLPRGWKKGGPGGGLSGRYLEATYPDANTMRDTHYADGSGSDEVTYRVALPQGADQARVTVRATLYYQSMPPYYLKALFDAAPDGPATRRLHHILGTLDLKGTAVEGWKLKVTSAESAVGKR